MKSELLTSLQPALAKVSAQGVRPYELPGFSEQICILLAEALTEKWTELRGIQMVSMSINSSDIPADDKARFQKWQDTAMLRSADMQEARKTEAFASMIEKTNLAGGNNGGEGGTAVNGAMNMMAMGMMSGMMGGGMNNMMGGQQNPQMQQMQNSQMQNPAAGAAPVLGWTCSCGKTDNRGKFCAECGAARPVSAGWTCSCGHVTQGKFCQECGKRKPEGAPLFMVTSRSAFL